jgi:hypothetical protein
MKKHISVALIGILLLSANAAVSAASKSAVYYVGINDQQQGPFDMRTLTQMVKEGMITGGTLVWKEGMADWASADSVDELRPLFGETSPSAASSNAKQDTDRDTTKGHKLYIGARFGAAYNMYTPEGDTKEKYGDKLGSSFSLFPAVSVSYNFIPLIALQAEVLYQADKAGSEGDTQTVTFDSKSLVIPVLVKAMFRLSRFTVGGFAGPYIGFPLAGVKTYPIGIMAGAEGGMRLGPGDIVIDIRYARDLVNGNTDAEVYKAGRVQLSAGYRFGLF